MSENENVGADQAVISDENIVGVDFGIVSGDENVVLEQEGISGDAPISTQSDEVVIDPVEPTSDSEPIVMGSVAVEETPVEEGVQAEVETAKYQITGLVDFFDEQGVIRGQLPIGSSQILPVQYGDECVRDGRAVREDAE